MEVQILGGPHSGKTYPLPDGRRVLNIFVSQHPDIRKANDLVTSSTPKCVYSLPIQKLEHNGVVEWVASWDLRSTL